MHRKRSRSTSYHPPLQQMPCVSPHLVNHTLHIAVCQAVLFHRIVAHYAEP
jgi:hypothetical protein